MGYQQDTEPTTVRVVLIKKQSGGRYEYIATVIRRNIGSIISLGGHKYCTGNSSGVEIFDVDRFTDEELILIMSGK